MTKEQIADRIREEFRKHGKNDPEGWPLFAAGKVLAEIRETGVEPKYYHITYWQQCGNAYSNDVRMEPVTFVNTLHPFTWIADWKKRAPNSVRVITNWQEISEAEYNQFRALGL